MDLHIVIQVPIRMQMQNMRACVRACVNVLRARTRACGGQSSCTFFDWNQIGAS
jgi:hypothetical protein